MAWHVSEKCYTKPDLANDSPQAKQSTFDL